ncbi:gene transfer agent family protein [Pararhizobium mangrovi]|uniref:Gene transfer agent family protein n=1 Tax=Pararhizobium mangrovi TaxID=2590452 RepID=A0A506UHH3_9HYPH|nr:gene transfer agent family protein [Pararhizobium mangrovi]TPW32760.1 gene transfer agent family protein [Pararhizobium mangrovi]
MGPLATPANRRRGEVPAVIDGRPRVLCLTLGALAELEAAFESADLNALAARFSAGRISAGDMIRIIAAGLRGAGEAVSEADVAAMRIEGGTAGAARMVSELLSAAFGGEDAAGIDAEAGANTPDP